jgi:hypothetical protein
MDWIHQQETNKKSIAILRVSSKQQERGTSLESQEKEIQGYCKEFGLEVIANGIFRISESAKDSHDRKKYKEAIRFALKNRIRHIIFYMNDRESRNLTDLEYNEKLVKQDKLVIHHVQDRKVFHQGSSVSDILVRNFTGIINKDYSLRLSVKINRGTLAKAEMGFYPASRPPMGYACRREIDENGREATRGIAYIVIDPNTKRVRQVQREFQLRALGKSLGEIRDQIIKEGFISKGKEKAYRMGAIEYRLKNKFYWGYFDWKGVQYRGKHQQLIQSDILRAVKKSFEVRNYHTGPIGRESLLGNWMRCGTEGCGRLILFDPKKKKIKSTGEIKVFPYYRCSNSRRIHPNLKGLAVTEDAILDKLKPIIGDASITDDFADKIRAAMKVVHEQAKDSIKLKAADYRQQLRDLRGQEDLAYNHFVDGTLTKEQYRRQIERIRDEHDACEEKLEAANLAITDAVYVSLDRLLELLIGPRKNKTQNQHLTDILTSALPGMLSFYPHSHPNSLPHFDTAPGTDTLMTASSFSSRQPLTSTDLCEPKGTHKSHGKCRLQIKTARFPCRLDQGLPRNIDARG